MLSFSVIIPLYNKARFVRAAVDSVLAQTFQNVEVIVVDDGSTDDGPAVVSAIQDKRVRLIRQPNGGVSRARNRGIEAATGDLVSFLDADDWYGPYFIETIATLAEQHQDIVFFGCGYRRTAKHVLEEWAQRPMQPVPVQMVDNYFEELRRHGPGVCTNSVAIRRSQLANMQPCFPPGESHGEDQDLWFRLSEQHALLYCPLPLVGYRMDVPGSLMKSQPIRVLPFIERLEQRALSGLMQGSRRRSALRLTADARTTIARDCIETGRRREAFEQLWRGRRALSRRWFISVLMALFFSPKMARRLRDWRNSTKLKQPLTE